MRNHLVMNWKCEYFWKSSSKKKKEYFWKSDDTYKLVLDLIKVVEDSYNRILNEFVFDHDVSRSYKNVKPCWLRC